jgi:hypothetical protein
MPKGFKSLADVLTEEEAFSNFSKSVKENRVIVEFENIFPEFKKVVTPSNVNKGILYITVENSVLRNELHLQKMLMINKINKHFNQQIIVDIKFANFRHIYRKTK